MKDDFLANRERWEKCRELLRETLRDPKYTVFHRHLQTLREEATTRVLRESDLTSIARDQGRVEILNRLLEDLFPENQA